MAGFGEPVYLALLSTYLVTVLRMTLFIGFKLLGVLSTPLTLIPEEARVYFLNRRA
jgi:hypothetical protein